MREFVFASEADLYGFATVGAKVCQVVCGSPAHRLGVTPGWHVAAVDGRALPGALMPSLQRGAPLVTTAELRALLGSRRAAACRSGAPVRLTFWTTTAPDPEASPRSGHPQLREPTAEELVRVLAQRFGTLERAWSEGLDPDQCGAPNLPGVSGGLPTPRHPRRPQRRGGLRRARAAPPAGRALPPARRQADHTVGRCAVCTLPNPCPKHGKEEQQDALDKFRGRRRPPARADADGA
ncbi:unnamed protein product [Prorocentrum cordatum]|nr:unnamed protein product [Polarella glacialis]